MSASARGPASHGRPVAPRTPGPLRPLGLDDVVLSGGFWGNLQRLNAETVIPHCLQWIRRVGTVDNFMPPQQRPTPERRGVLFTDSDAYKVAEALAWEIGRAGSPEPERQLNELTDSIGRAMEADGYINTYWGAYSDRKRYTDLQMGHELYCMGHLIQAGVARLRTHGPDPLTELARRAADHVCRRFGPDCAPAVDGHPEIEVALVELYRSTGEQRYLRTAQVMIERRGRGLLGEGMFGAAYYQDDVPVRDAKVLGGHAVRALYLAASAVDVAVETGDDELLQAVITQWTNTIARRTYLTGGMGSRHRDEAFGDDFELPPDRSYSETCAGVAAIMLSHRLLLATGDARYADLIERTLYNIVAASVAEDGASFFYTNTMHRRMLSTPPPAESESTHAATGMRAPWFSVPCCPPNVARTISSLAGYVATSDGDGIQLHQYASGTIRAELDTGRAGISVRTDYPWDGLVEVTVTETLAGPWTLTLRIPPWAEGASIEVNGQPHPAKPGTATMGRSWTVGDQVLLRLPIRPRWTLPDGRIDAIRGCAALEAGPIIYCLELLADEDLDLDAIQVETDTPQTTHVSELNGVPAFLVEAFEVPDRLLDVGWPYHKGASTPPATSELSRHLVTLVPYHSWANRGISTMRVWLPTVPSRD